MPELQEIVQTALFVYLCTGEVKVFPEAHRVEVQDNELVCLDEAGCELARFRTGDVYICTRKPVPRALL